MYADSNDEDVTPSTDDLVDILVGRMETHVQEFEGHGPFSGLTEHIEAWVDYRQNPDMEDRLYYFDFFSEEQKTRLWEGLKSARCKAFTAKVMEQVFKPPMEENATQVESRYSQGLMQSNYPYQLQNQLQNQWRVQELYDAQRRLQAGLMGQSGDKK